MTSPRFTMVVLLIDDVPRSVAFYRRLGVDLPDDADDPDGNTVLVTAG